MSQSMQAVIRADTELFLALDTEARLRSTIDGRKWTRNEVMIRWLSRSSSEVERLKKRVGRDAT